MMVRLVLATIALLYTLVGSHALSALTIRLAGDLHSIGRRDDPTTNAGCVPGPTGCDPRNYWYVQPLNIYDQACRTGDSKQCDSAVCVQVLCW